MIRVRELMSSPTITCRPDDTLDQAARLMWDHDCGVVVVVSETGQLVGVLTDRDICMAGYTRGQQLQQLAVGDAMTRQVYSCQATDSIHRALSLMKRYQVRRLPVVNADDCPIGLISLNNLVRYAAWSDDRLRRELIESMERICQPRWLESMPQAQRAAPTARNRGGFEEQSSREPGGAISWGQT